MDRPEDYKKLGVNPDKIEAWEDARRGSSDSMNWEWWYFDAITDDGTAIVIQFLMKPIQYISKKGDFPAINFQITLPSGKSYNELITIPAQKCYFGKEYCDIRFGENVFRGNLHDYIIHAKTASGQEADLRLHSLSQPFRPGTAYFDFKNNGEQYYTWLCVVPKGEVTGSLILDGMKINIHGYGYHDHQWGNFVYLFGWNHWTWARQRYDDYTLTLFDMHASKASGGTHFPLVYLEDQTGEIVFSSTKSENCTVEILDEYTDELTKKFYPKKTRFTFGAGGQKLVYTLTEDKIQEAPDTSKLIKQPMKTLLSLKGLKPSCARYLATGEMDYTKQSGHSEHRKDTLIYEFMYPGKSYKSV